MFEAAIAEFPFVGALPKREKSRVVKVWDLVNHMAEVSKTEGALLPVMLVAKALGLSRTRIDEICADGRLRRVLVDGHVFITENSVVEFAKLDRVWGRNNVNLPKTVAETWRRATSRS